MDIGPDSDVEPAAAASSHSDDDDDPGGGDGDDAAGSDTAHGQGTAYCGAAGWHLGMP